MLTKCTKYAQLAPNGNKKLKNTALTTLQAHTALPLVGGVYNMTSGHLRILRCWLCVYTDVKEDSGST